MRTGSPYVRNIKLIPYLVIGTAEMSGKKQKAISLQTSNTIRLRSARGRECCTKRAIKITSKNGRLSLTVGRRIVIVHYEYTSK